MLEGGPERSATDRGRAGRDRRQRRRRGAQRRRSGGAAAAARPSHAAPAVRPWAAAWQGLLPAPRARAWAAAFPAAAPGRGSAWWLARAATDSSSEGGATPARCSARAFSGLRRGRACSCAPATGAPATHHLRRQVRGDGEVTLPPVRFLAMLGLPPLHGHLRFDLVDLLQRPSRGRPASRAWSSGRTKAARPGSWPASTSLLPHLAQHVVLVLAHGARCAACARSSPSASAWKHQLSRSAFFCFRGPPSLGGQVLDEPHHPGKQTGRGIVSSLCDMDWIGVLPVDRRQSP